jgi:guanylate kinase
MNRDQRTKLNEYKAKARAAGYSPSQIAVVEAEAIRSMRTKEVDGKLYVFKQAPSEFSKRHSLSHR